MWIGKLQAQYRNKKEFKAYDEMYALSQRLGFNSATEAWDTNPVIQGSTNPSDYSVAALADWDKVEDGWYYHAIGEKMEVHLQQDDDLGYCVSVLREAVPIKNAVYRPKFVDAIVVARNEVAQLLKVHDHARYHVVHKSHNGTKHA